MLFSYEAIDATGARQSGVEEAGSESGVVALLIGRDLTPISVRIARPASGSDNPRGTWKRRESGGRVALVLMVRELASLLGAGVTLEESLRTLIESRRGLALETPLTSTLALVLAGERFSTAVRKQSDAGALALPSYVVALISAGESTGDLAGALGRAAEQLEFDEQVRAETAEALVYPIILVLAGAAAVLFVFSFVVPRFSKLLAGRQVDLPWLSAAVLGIGEYVNRHALLIGIGIAALVVLGSAAWKTIGAVRIRGALARLPVLGSWIRQQELSRWTGMLALMLQSRVPILTALDLTAQAITLADVARRLRLTMGDIGRGESLSRSLAEYRLLPATALSMVRVGERTGQVGSMMGHVASYALEQNRRQRKRMVALIEPAAIIVLGGIIALIIVGVMLALTSLSEVKF
ncbi:MAG: type II secretion system F family protein [Burkholderiales bacterium]|nr:type II secretion system F family protein [Burkholderiales bacterium]